MRINKNIAQLLFPALMVILLSTCGREYSTEGGIYSVACNNNYTGSCKLLKIEYTAASVLGVANTVDLTYTGTQLATASDALSNRTFTYQAGLIKKIEYRDPATGFRSGTETINYISINSTWKVSLIKGSRFLPTGIDSTRISSSYNAAGRLTKKIQDRKPMGSSVWTMQKTYDYSYDAAGNVYQVIVNDLSVSPTQTRTIPLTWSRNCNNWQKVFPQIELLDYSGREELGGLTVIFTSRLFAATTDNLFTTFTLNNSLAVQKYYQNNILIATYTYDCP